MPDMLDNYQSAAALIVQIVYVVVAIFVAGGAIFALRQLLGKRKQGSRSAGEP